MMRAIPLKRTLAFFDQVLFQASISAFLFWSTFSPLKFSFLIWLVPFFWANLIQQSNTAKIEMTRSLSFKREASQENPAPPRFDFSFYLKIWLAGTAFWMMTFSWVFEFNHLVGVVLISLFCSLVVSLYWVLFIGLSRLAVHNIGLPIIVVTPIVWCGLEWTRKNWLLGGFSFGSLEHTQYENTTLIQIADLFGEYGIGMLVVFVGTCLSYFYTRKKHTNTGFSRIKIMHTPKFTLISLVSVLLLVIGYGKYCLSSAQTNARSNSPEVSRSIALIQGDVDFTMVSKAELIQQSLKNCINFTKQVGSSVDLVVWPESIELGVYYDFQEGFIPEGWNKQPKEDIKIMLKKIKKTADHRFLELARKAETNVLLNVHTYLYSKSGKYHLKNSALFIDRKNGINSRYDKVNLATFIEYNPLAKYLPDTFRHIQLYSPGSLMSVSPIRLNSKQTDGYQESTDTYHNNQEDDSFSASVYICYDSSFPHFIRNQINQQIRDGRSPDVIINIGNDMSWRFTTLIEMHLATHVFRAIETRRPYLTATNAGYSAWINRKGQIVKKGEKGASTYIIADIQKQKPITSWYMYWGDWLPFCCFLFNLFIVGYWIVTKFKFSIKNIPLSHSKTSISHNG